MEYNPYQLIKSISSEERSDAGEDSPLLKDVAGDGGSLMPSIDGVTGTKQ